jgi:hypothetical protein
LPTTHPSLPSHAPLLIHHIASSSICSPSLARIRANDVVELWCCGANVPGAWLESRVKRVRNGRYCVGKVRRYLFYLAPT